MKTSHCRQRLHSTELSLRNTPDGLEWDRMKTQRASQSVTAPDSQLGCVRCHTGRVWCSIGRKLRNSLRQQFSPDSLHRTKTQRVLQTELALDAHLEHVRPHTGRVRPHIGRVRPHIGRVRPIRTARNDLQLLPLLPCANTKVSQHLCKCVSIFTNMFPRELVSQTSHATRS